MPCCTNQSSVAKAWKECWAARLWRLDARRGSPPRFDDDGRMKDSDFRGRVVDVAEEFHKFTLIMREYKDDLNDRYSERFETAEKGRLQTQAEKEAARDKELARTA